MYETKNLTYILTILESIEKIFLYTESIEGGESFLNPNNQMNFFLNIYLLSPII